MPNKEEKLKIGKAFFEIANLGKPINSSSHKSQSDNDAYNKLKKDVEDSPLGNIFDAFNK